MVCHVTYSQTKTQPKKLCPLTSQLVVEGDMFGNKICQKLRKVVFVFVRAELILPSKNFNSFVFMCYRNSRNDVAWHMICTRQQFSCAVNFLLPCTKKNALRLHLVCQFATEAYIKVSFSIEWGKKGQKRKKWEALLLVSFWNWNMTRVFLLQLLLYRRDVWRLMSPDYKIMEKLSDSFIHRITDGERFCYTNLNSVCIFFFYSAR